MVVTLPGGGQTTVDEQNKVLYNQQMTTLYGSQWTAIQNSQTSGVEAFPRARSLIAGEATTAPQFS